MSLKSHNKRSKLPRDFRGPMSMYAFFVQEERSKVDSVVFKEFSKQCSEKWKTLSNEEKLRFLELATNDRKRFDLQMEDFKEKNKDNGNGKRKYRKRDINAPKRALTAFFWFAKDERSKIRLEMPGATLSEVSKELGRRWQNCPLDIKKNFEDISAKDSKRYEKEILLYRQMTKKKEIVKELLNRCEVNDDCERVPKRPQSAFFWFAESERSNIAIDMPGAVIGRVTAELGRRWELCNDDVRKKFELMAVADNARYEREMILLKYKLFNTNESAAIDEQMAEVKEETQSDSDETDEDMNEMVIPICNDIEIEVIKPDIDDDVSLSNCAEPSLQMPLYTDLISNMTFD